MAVALFALQALLVAPLFSGEFTRYRGSIEAAYITDARFIVDHFPDLSWNPFWYLGFPFEWFYTPLLPGLVAIVGKLIDDVPAAYRLVAATGYALGPAALYVATREVARSRTAAVFAAVAFVFLPSVSYLLPGLQGDASAFSGAALPPPWRLIALVEYGEGPHVLSLSLALLALAAGARYIRAPSTGRLLVAVVAVIAVALTNLIGVLGAAVFLALVPASERMGGRAEGRYARLFVIGALASLLSMGWYSLGFIRAVFGFSTPGGGGGTAYLWLPVLLIATLAAVAWLDGRLPEGGSLAVGWTAVFGAIVVARQFAGVELAPQPIRYALELDAAAAIGIGIAVSWLLGRIADLRVPRSVWLGAAAAIAAMFIALGAGGWLAVRGSLAADGAWRDWSERRVALWLNGHLAAGERAYLTGDHAFWAGVFADVPQVRGGVDFAFANPWWAHVTYQVNVGPDADVSVLWMQALPVRYIVVTGPSSTEVYRDFAEPTKFDGRLPVVFDERGVRIYEVTRIGDPRLVVVRVADLAAPTSAIDRDAISAYMKRMTDGRAPSLLETRGLGAWRAEVEIRDGEQVVLRQAYDTGWRATVDGRAANVRADPIGQLLVEVPPGRHVVELDHRIHGDLMAGVAVALFTVVVIAATSLTRRFRVRQR
ncbi:MAG TPA: hypothetical protein VGQ86_01380 [Candidatus Limnocylindria bacterium]|nr:hypothetical protein [Candidatus Limnocylindria bacterium]